MKRVQKAGAQVDIVRLQHLSGIHFRRWLRDDPRAIEIALEDRYPQKTRHLSRDFMRRIINCVAERVQKIPDILEFGAGFIETPKVTCSELIQRGCPSAAPIHAVIDAVAGKDFDDVDSLSKAIASAEADHHLRPNSMLPALRWSLFGSDSGPGVARVMSTLQREKTIERLKAAASTFDAIPKSNAAMAAAIDNK